MKQSIYIFIAIALMGSSCNKEQNEVPEPILAATVIMQFQNVVDGTPIALDGTEYENSLGQMYSISAWKYFVSNVEFYNDGSLIYKEKDSYHFINEKDESTLEFKLYDVPEGSYDEIRYSFGIDPDRNNGDSTNGDISPGTGMFWPMGGYRFSNFDGESNGAALAFHSGGSLNYTVLTFDSGIIMEVVGNKNTLIHSMVNLNSMFDAPNQIDFTTTSTLATEQTSIPLTENIANGMFMIHHIENPE